MEGNEGKLELNEYCRICLNRTTDSLDKMFELNVFLPVIRLISQTKLLQDCNTPSKICGSCANGLILANIFRIKVIESNGKCRELLKSLHRGTTTDNEEIVEHVQENIGKVNTKRRDFSLQDPASIIKVEVQEEDLMLDSDAMQESRGEDTKENVKNMLEPDNIKTCLICSIVLNEDISVKPYKMTLSKMIWMKEIEDKKSICASCVDITVSAEKLMEIREKVRNVKEEGGNKREKSQNECQFCLINDVFSTRTPKYLVNKFNLMPMCKENEKNKISSDAKSCKECMKLLKQIYSLLTQHFKGLKMSEDTIKSSQTKEKSDPSCERMDFALKSKRITSKRIKVAPKIVGKNSYSSEVSDEEAVPLSKFVKRRKRKLKLRPKPKYVKPNPRASFPEDYQCHMSDFEEDESDSGVTTPQMGEPLNQPFKHRYKQCTECKMKYITDFELEVHYDVQHRTKGDICEHCNKKFINFVGVKAHKHKVHFADCSSVSLFRELCDICGVLTKTLEEHQSIHFDARPFVCHQCAHSSKTKDLLAAHVRAMHTGEKRYGCKYCEKRFSYSADRARHEISSHTKQYKYVCRTCNKGFLKKNFLTSHQKTHEGTFLDEM
ncbi:zinc finger protein 724-like [Culicoides brevitarsis]|uniref:zinc finger protein 724-like n=1 Tax=Culicoides brevitarsis TaxID=469753 RepID=UPI00307CB5AC